MGVILGLDFGQKRIGIALSDETRTVAVPHTMIEFRGRNQLLDALRMIVEDYRVEEIVAGLPKNLKGEIGPAAQAVMDHVDWLKGRLDLKWTLWDERLSSREIERVLQEAELHHSRRREVRDQLAAQRILQSYLDYRKTNLSPEIQ